MRLQLAVAAIAGGAIGVLGMVPARADGTLAMRGVYYKERATRVMQPMLDAVFDAGAHGVATGHLLIDAITSASASSGAADSVPFTERRYEGGLGYAHQLGDITVGGDAKYSTESDYTSIYAGVRGQIELFQKNTVVAAGGGISWDTVEAAAAQGPSMPTLRCDDQHVAETECALRVYAGAASVSQIVSPDAVVAASIDVSALRGYQSNPYRQAIVGQMFVAERHPTERNRQAFAVSARYYAAPITTTVIAAYRYYRDDWKVHAHTPELRLVHEASSDIEIGLRYRYYRQDGAYFYRDRYPPDDPTMPPQYVSDDVKLSTFTGHSIEGKLDVLGEAFHLPGRWAGARAEAILEYAVQNNRFGNAFIAHAALTIPFEY